MSPQFDTLIPTRYSLLSRLKDWDDQESWKEFFNIYWRLIYSLAIKSGLTDAEAQDVVQETVISVAKHIHKFRCDRSLGTFKGWLRNIIRWRIADQLEKRYPARHSATPVDESGRDVSLNKSVDPLEYPDPGGDRLITAWEEEWRLNLFEAALERVKSRVKEEYIQAFDLYAVKHWAAAKVARTVGIHVSQVYLAKHRVARLIRSEVKLLEKLRW